MQGGIALREAGKMAKVALITGAGTGIGKASALALAQDGYDVVLGGRRREPLERSSEHGWTATSRSSSAPA